MDQLTQQFLSKVTTKAEAYKALRILREFLDFIHFSSPVKTTQISSSSDLSFTMTEFQLKHLSRISNEYITEQIELLRSFNQDFFNQFDPKSAAAKLESLKQTVDQTDPIILHIPFEMPREETKKVGLWIKENINPVYLLEIRFDPSMVAGCMISFKGTSKDYSIRKKIEDNQVQVNQILSGFKKANQ